MVTDLEEVRRLAESKERENREFRRHLKTHHCLEGPFHVIARQVEREIDCTACANCCREMTVSVSRKDVEAIARFLRQDPEDVSLQYTLPDPETGETKLRQVDDACVFLDGNLCMIYEARPQVCRNFPAIVSDRRALGNRMDSVCRQAVCCPIVYNSLERYKKLTGYHPPRQD